MDSTLFRFVLIFKKLDWKKLVMIILFGLLPNYLPLIRLKVELLHFLPEHKPLVSEEAADSGLLSHWACWTPSDLRWTDNVCCSCVIAWTADSLSTPVHPVVSESAARWRSIVTSYLSITYDTWRLLPFAINVNIMTLFLYFLMVYNPNSILMSS